MPGFILFAIFSLAMGLSVVVPEMDPTRPAEVDPERIREAIKTPSPFRNLFVFTFLNH